MATVRITDRSAEVLSAMRTQVARALETCGLIAEGHAKVNITEQKAIDTGNLRNSITHTVNESEKAMYIGTNVEYAPYIEFGTGEFSEVGGRRTAWVYQDSEGNFYTTTGMVARPYLRPAISEHLDEYERIIKDELSNG